MFVYTSPAKVRNPYKKTNESHNRVKSPPSDMKSYSYQLREKRKKERKWTGGQHPPQQQERSAFGEKKLQR